MGERQLRRWREEDSFLDELGRFQQEVLGEATRSADRSLAVPATAVVERAIERENPWVALRVLDGLGVLSRKIALEVRTSASFGEVRAELDHAGKVALIEMARAIKGLPPPALIEEIPTADEQPVEAQPVEDEPTDTLTRAARAS